MSGTPEPRQGTLLQTFKAVLWAFFGIRRRADYERDATRLNPVMVVIAAIVAAAAFVVTLLVIVHQVVK